MAFEWHDPFRRRGMVFLALVLSLCLGLPPSGGSADAGEKARQMLAQGWQHFHEHVPAEYAIALGYFERAKEADPDNAGADAALAALYWRSYEEFWFNVLGVGRSDAPSLARRHLEAALQSPTARAHEVDCRMTSFMAKHDQALAACEKAIALDPEDADIRHAMALALINAGKPESALSQVREARRIDPAMEEYHGYYEGMARFFGGDSAAAVVALESAMAARPELWAFEKDFDSAICNPCIFLIAALADLGRTDEAKRLVDSFLAYHSGWTINGELYFRPLRREEDIDRLTNALRSAGVPE